MLKKITMTTMPTRMRLTTTITMMIMMMMVVVVMMMLVVVINSHGQSRPMGCQPPSSIDKHQYSVNPDKNDG